MSKDDDINQQSQQAQVDAQKAAGAPAEKKRSRGNIIFDSVVWPVLQVGVVWYASLAIGNNAVNGKGKLNEWFKKGSEAIKPLFDKLVNSKTGTMRGATSQQWSDNMLLAFALGLGGWVITPVIKVFEDNRKPISNFFEKIFGGKATDPSQVKEEPTQTWASMLSGRLTGFLVGWGVFVAFGPKKLGDIATKVGAITADLFMKMRPSANRIKVQEFAETGVFDFVITSITAAITYAFSRKLASKGLDETVAATTTAATQGNVTEKMDVNLERTHSKEWANRTKPRTTARDSIANPAKNKEDKSWVKTHGTRDEAAMAGEMTH